ncbi:protein of unknown function [Legionella fallonii LLAP-10]|uniref:Uncharacterized protein n=1 Tax=Legionella fallonii LLAP-10 TaxID=1212491 RepID=A0A098G8M1_9GAMM|nr:protein of unknown function [Legionella fallonii LLAP-10]
MQELYLQAPFFLIGLAVQTAVLIPISIFSMIIYAVSSVPLVISFSVIIKAL